MENDKPNYYAVIPANVRYDNELRPNEKLLYGEISALANKTGVCYANNEYFSKLYDVKLNAISTWIKHLKEKEYIKIEYEYEPGTKEIKKRYISIGTIQKDITWYSKRYEGGIQKDEDNNTSINNNKENINNKLFIKEKNFKKPTLEEVRDYCLERNNSIDPESFIDFYESKGWMIGKSKMKDWKAAVRNWEHKNKPQVEKKSKQQLIYEELKKKYEQEERNEQKSNT